MSDIGVKYWDKYAVTETFQLLKIPWEWYDASKEYDVVIAKKEDVPDYHGNIIDLTDIFKNIREQLNEGQMNLHNPSVERWIDDLRTTLKQYTTLVEIPPSPWGYPYMVALTHDVDSISVRQSSFKSALVTAARCFLSFEMIAGMKILLAKIGMAEDPWLLFKKWRELEGKLGVRSTFYIIPPFTRRCVRGYHQYREIYYTADQKELDALRDGGWEVGVHSMNWDDPQAVIKEKEHIPGGVGNRTHWLLHDRDSWGILDAAGYEYDTTFGYDDDVGYRAGTTQVYQPENTTNLLELPLHIQDMGLFGKSCWALNKDEWIKIPCLHMTEKTARDYLQQFFLHMKSFGGVITILWHYEDLTAPRTWMIGTYLHLVDIVKKDGAWITTAKNVVNWFRIRRQTKMGYSMDGKKITISINQPPGPEYIPEQKVRVHISPSLIEHIDGEFVNGDNSVDILCKPEITVVFK